MPGATSEAPLRLPPMCSRCLVNRAAWTRPRIDVCYDCLPGGPFTPPPCSNCGATDDYFSQGLCGRCHPRSPEHIGSCKGCLAWGVYPRYDWTCWSCRIWRRFYPEGICPYCGRTSRISESGCCRLCYEQARLRQEPGKAINLAEANKHGQQLFFANLVYQRTLAPRAEPTPTWKKRLRNYQAFQADTGFHDGWVQDALFDADPDPAAVLARAVLQDSDLTRYCAAIVNDHAARYGWSTRQRLSVIHSLRVLQTVRPTPEAKIRASEVVGLRHYGGTTTSTIEVLAEAGLLIQDIPTRLETFFASKTDGLPPLMVEHLTIWMHIQLAGSLAAPRQAPRDPITIQNYLRAIAPFAKAWAEAGHQSFAEITRDQIVTGLDTIPGRPIRSIAYLGLKSLFTTLKARQLVFANPTRSIRAVTPQTNIPLPLDTALVRRELDSPNPAVALAVALVGFHALTNKQLRALKLTDIVDGRLSLGDRDIPLAGPVRTRLATWLDYRNKTWPATANPYLIINRKTAPRIMPVSATYPWSHSDLRSHQLREDRILNEIHATGGDVRRISDLFGLTISGTTRYLATVEHPELARDPQVPRT